MNLPVQKRVFDPVNNKFTNIESRKGMLIKEYNDFCEKCPVEDIYDFASGKCKKTTDKRVKNKLKEEIEYCKKYNKAMKRAISDDSRIMSNILNIRIPDKFFNKPNLKIRDFVSEIVSSKNTFLAKRLNIKNLAYAEYVNFIPILIYTLYKLISLNPELKSILLSAISKILSSTKGGLVSIYIKVFTDYIKSDFLMSLVSQFSFTKFIAFVTSVLAVFTNMPTSSRENSQKMTRVSEIIATGKNVPFDIFNLDHTNTVSDTRKTINPDPTETYLLKETIKADYKDSDNTISLAKLGINNKITASENTQLEFGYDDERELPFVKIKPFGNIKARKDVLIIPEKERKNKIEDLINKTTTIIKILEKKQKSLIKLREDIKKSKYVKELNEDIQKTELEKEKNRKGSYLYNKLSKKISTDTKKYDKLKKELESFSDIPLEEKKTIADNLRNITEWNSTLLSLRREMKKINSTNFNFSYIDFKYRIDTSERFVKTFDDTAIRVTKLPTVGKKEKENSDDFFKKSKSSPETNSLIQDLSNKHFIERDFGKESYNIFKIIPKKSMSPPKKSMSPPKKSMSPPKKSMSPKNSLPKKSMIQMLNPVNTDFDDILDFIDKSPKSSPDITFKDNLKILGRKETQVDSTKETNSLLELVKAAKDNKNLVTKKASPIIEKEDDWNNPWFL
jgi:hypothetical protein